MSCGCGYNMDGRRDDDFLSDLLGNNENTEILMFIVVFLLLFTTYGRR
ncbi:unknown [Clostridium sp. CAG:793]|nr:unknown [Clostridium sp. CAG:793]